MSSHAAIGHTTRPRARIDLSALRHNYDALKSIVGERVQIGASVKADAYGLGLGPTAKALYGAGTRTFFVATPGEGKLLRDEVGDNCTIYVLNGIAPQDHGLFFKARLRPVLNSPEQIKTWTQAREGVRNAPYCAVMIDTGMNRLGLSEADTRKLAGSPALQKSIGLDHVMSHLACAPDRKHPLNASQLERFRTLSALFPDKTRSLANSAGVFLGKDYHFDMVRPGISLYGGTATDSPTKEPTRPVVTLAASVLQLKEVGAGESIGYDARFTAPAAMRIAVCGIGYADGLPVQLSGIDDRPGYTARVNAQDASIVGRISMDLTILDVTGLEVAVGHTAEFFGPRLNEAAEMAGTIDYALLTGLGQRLRRTYLRGTPSPPLETSASESATRSPRDRDRSSPRRARPRPRS